MVDKTKSSFGQAKGAVEKVNYDDRSKIKGFRRDPADGGMAVLPEIRTGIHPEGQAQSLR
jgi:hypothetical protein